MGFLKLAGKGFFIFLNLLVILFLFLGCYGCYFNSGDSWILGFFCLATFYIFLITIGFLIAWLLINPKWSLMSVMAILICWMPLRHVYKIGLGSSFVYEKSPEVVRVMSWNVEQFNMNPHKKTATKKQEMIDLINEFNPDIACFQEMVGSNVNRTAKNYIPDFEKNLKMKGSYFSYSKILDYDGKQSFGIITFSKYPIINKQTVYGDLKNYNTIFQYVDIVAKGDTFRIFNIHLQSLRFSTNNRSYIDDPSISGGNDINQSKSILRKFRRGFILRHEQCDNVRKTMDESPYPVIVCGDFNDVPNSYAYHTIGNNLKNAFVEKGTGLGTTFSDISPTLRIDNIFTDKNCEITQFKRVKKILSDHFPIITDFSYKK
jgi:endonuclease/exonuclease/phosphatase family metal-dependent hydrolase